MAYSKEIREKALRQYIDGYTDEQIGESLGISKHTIGNWKKLLLTTGSLEKKKVNRKSGTPYKYKPEKLEEALNKSQLSEMLADSHKDKAKDSLKVKKSKRDKKKKKKDSL